MGKCVRWKSGKGVDPRLVNLLESFREPYVKRREFFKKTFPGLCNEFQELFKELGAVASTRDEMKARTTERGLSPGSPKLRPRRFRVRTPIVGVVQPAGGGGGGGCQSSQGETKSTVSK